MFLLLTRLTSATHTSQPFHQAATPPLRHPLPLIHISVPHLHDVNQVHPRLHQGGVAAVGQHPAAGQDRTRAQQGGGEGRAATLMMPGYNQNAPVYLQQPPAPHLGILLTKYNMACTQRKEELLHSSELICGVPLHSKTCCFTSCHRCTQSCQQPQQPPFPIPPPHPTTASRWSPPPVSLTVCVRGAEPSSTAQPPQH